VVSRRTSWWRRPNLVHAARVAAVATLLIALISVVLAVAVNTFLARRVVWEVDQRLSARVAEVTHLSKPLTNPVDVEPEIQGTDGTPVVLWWVQQGGSIPTAITTGAPALGADQVPQSGQPLSVTTSEGSFRVVPQPWHGGTILAGQNLAEPRHVVTVLIAGELILGPMLLVAVFFGVLVIGMMAVAPVEEARRRQLEFTADASHELRTPLSVIEAELDLAGVKPGAPGETEDRMSLTDPGAVVDSDRETLLRVARESRRIHRIVEDMLWLARSDADLPVPDAVPVELHEAVVACTARFAAVARARQIDLVVTGQSAWVDGSLDWLDKLVGTLVDNACRYTPRGGEVRVSVSERSGRVTLQVEDSGPGVPESDRTRLFDRFGRATDQPGGAGLGLAIADSVVRATGGRWRVADSELGGLLMEVQWRQSGDTPATAGFSPEVDRKAGPHGTASPGAEKPPSQTRSKHPVGRAPSAHSLGP
jgi:two-component system, OmpR family, sensor histidine kinase CiaH